MLNIKLINMQFYGFHGVLEEETRLGQAFQADVIIYIPDSIQEDILERTIDYAGVYSIIKNMIENETYKLIEMLATKIADKLYNTYQKQINRVIIRIRKPAAPIKGILDFAEVEIDRSYE